MHCSLQKGCTFVHDAGKHPFSCDILHLITGSGFSKNLPGQQAYLCSGGGILLSFQLGDEGVGFFFHCLHCISCRGRNQSFLLLPGCCPGRLIEMQLSASLTWNFSLLQFSNNYRSPPYHPYCDWTVKREAANWWAHLFASLHSPCTPTQLIGFLCCFFLPHSKLCCSGTAKEWKNVKCRCLHCLNLNRQF